MLLKKGGLLIHPKHPWLGASLDYYIVDPSTGQVLEIVEVKSWSRIPESIPIETQAQVATQLAISKESDLFDWGSEIPKAVVVVGSPNNDQISIVSFHFNKELTENWEEQLLPKAFFYYFNGVLPRLGKYLAPLPVITGRTSTPLPIMQCAENEEDDLSDKNSDGGEDMPYTPVASPTFREGKWVNRPDTSHFGELLENTRDVEWIVKWTHTKSDRRVGCSAESLQILPKAPHDMVTPCANDIGGYVLVCGGSYNFFKGKLETFNNTYSSVKFGAESKRVRTSYLHVINGKSPSETAPSAFVPRRFEIPVTEVEEWLNDFQIKNDIDLVLVRVNYTNSKQLFNSLLNEAKRLAAEKAQVDEENGASALLNLKLT